MKEKRNTKLSSVEKAFLSTWNEPWDSEKIEKWNNIQSQKMNVFLLPLTLTLIGAGVGAIIGLAGSLRNSSEHRRIAGQEQEIIGYLKDIEQKLADIYQLNQKILDTLNNLPDVIRRVLKDHDLEKSYTTVEETFYKPFCWHAMGTLENGTAGYLMLLDTYNYIAKYEYRFSYYHKLITISEFILSITHNTSIATVKEHIFNKKQELQNVLNIMKNDIDISVNRLIRYNWCEYIKGESMSNLQNINDYKYTLAPPHYIQYTVKEPYDCHYVSRGTREHGTEVLVCNYKDVTHEKVDEAWVNMQNAYDLKIKALVSDLTIKISNYKDIETLYNELNSYYELLASEKRTRTFLKSTEIDELFLFNTSQGKRKKK
jgi:hypothetical protein